MKAHLIFGLLIAILFSAKGQKADPDIVRNGQIMPEFTIVSDNGRELKSSTFKGKVIVINFFATWCPPCQKELAEIQKTLWPKYKDNKDFTLLVIGREHNDAELQTYNEKKGFTFPLYPDKNREIYGKFATSLIPRTYLIGKDGKVIYQSTGFNEADFETLMKNIAVALK